MSHVSGDDDRTSFALPLLIWLAAQLVAIGIGAARVRLWARFPATGETLALDELIVVQFLVSSLLFPILCRDFRATCAIFGASLPMIAVAGLLAFRTTNLCIASAINLGFWLLALGVWEKVVVGDVRRATKVTQPPDALRGMRQLIAVAVISAVVFGGIFLAYFSYESTGSISPLFRAAPVIAAIQLAHEFSWWGFVPNLGLLVIALIAMLIQRVMFSPAVIP